MKTKNNITIPKSPSLLERGWGEALFKFAKAIGRGFVVRLLIITIVILTLNSCCKKIPPPEFTTDQLAWMPYNEGDTLIFKSDSTGETLSFYVEKVNRFESNGSECSNPYNESRSSRHYTLFLTQVGKVPISINHLLFLNVGYSAYSELKSINGNVGFKIKVSGIVIPINDLKTITINNKDYYDATKFSIGNSICDSVIIAKKYGIISLLYTNNEWFNLTK